MKKYQTFFNKRNGYRENLAKPFWWYIGEYRKRFFIKWEDFNNSKPARTSTVEIRGPRGGHTGKYTRVLLPFKKATQYGYGVWLFPWHIGLVFKVTYTVYIYKQYIITLGITELNWQIEFKIENMCY